VTQVSFERTVGTLAGGLLGLVTVLLGREMMQVTDQAFTGDSAAVLSLESALHPHPTHQSCLTTHASTPGPLPHARHFERGGGVSNTSVPES